MGPVVLVSIDTLRADHLPAYGSRRVRTPAIDALAADGQVFEQAYAHSPQTLPSHASILSGRLPFEHGVRDNMGFALKPDERLLSSMLGARGYETAAFVSAYVLRAATGLGAGFDEYDDTLPTSSTEIALGDVQRDGADTVAAVDRWLDSKAASPFFLFVHLYEPHTPYTPPARFSEYPPYDGEIAYADELVGRLIASLTRRGLYDTALVILLSDHGEGLGDHGEAEHGLFLYRETIRVPLIVKLPGARGAGGRVREPVQHIDLVPTILDLAGAPRPTGLGGRSLVPALAGQPLPEQGLYAESLYGRYHFGWSELYALTDGRYRYIQAPRDELYDVEADPGERANLAPVRESTRVGMRRALDTLLASATIEAPGAMTPEDRARLEALGYVGARASVPGDADADALPDPKDHVQVLAAYDQARDLVRQGRFGEAIDQLRAIADGRPAMVDIWIEIGGLLVREGRLEEAVEAYKRVVEAAPRDRTALIGVADGLYRLGRLDEARAQAEAAVALVSESEGRWRAAAHEILARIAIAQHDLARARSEAERGSQADPTLPLVAMVEGLIRHGAGQFAEAAPYFDTAVRESVDRVFAVPDLHYYLGDTLARLDRFDEAEVAFKDELRRFPYNQRAWAGLAMLYRATGRDREAEEAIATMVRRSPTEEAYGLAARLWTMFGETERAAAAQAEALRRRR